jgi:adenosylcobinamide-phosphate synthase
MTFFPDTLLVVLAALAFDALIGDPDAVWRRVPHPVAWQGALIGWLDRRLNRDDDWAGKRAVLGVLTVAVVCGASAGAGALVEALLGPLPFAWLWLGLVASVFIAQRSLYEHVARVSAAFGAGGLPAARRAVSMIVGRDPESLDEAGVARAAIETTAENFSDGIVAPVLFLALFGLPGLFAYKALNTADSMIGHRTPRHEAFGFPAARLDDVANLVPARLSGVLLALAGARPLTALRVMWRDARLHRSPNAGWPESAMAGSLGLALAGPRRYGARLVQDPFLNAEGRRDAAAADIDRGLSVYLRALALHGALYAVLALAMA